MEQNYDPDGKIALMVEPLFESMAARGTTHREVELMRKAFDTAAKAHFGQKRRSGEPYIIHPVAVALIVGDEMLLDAEVVCAAFLHDVVEDTPYTIDEVEQNFGQRVAMIVEAVTKKKKKEYFMSKQVDNYKHMLDSVKHDRSALLLKLADRLHNMRTLDSMPAAKQMKIAGETDFFYAPLALRLGFYKVKTELENLSFRFRCPRDYYTLVDQLREERQHILPYLEDFRDKVNERLDAHGIKAHIDIITRKPYSIYRKMLRKNVDFQHMSRIHSIHIIYDCDDIADEKAQALRIYELLTDIFKEKPHSVTNYIDNPKANGYQSLHVHVLAGNGHWQEVRISSRRMAHVQNYGCISADSEAYIGAWLERLKTNIADMLSSNTEISFMDGVRASFYNDDITAYAVEDGIGTILPEKASVIDFAFEKYGEKALHAQCAFVNSKLKPMITELERGDIVSVVFNDEVWPDDDWIDHVRTYKAKKHLMAYLDSKPRRQLLRCEHCLPLPGDEVVGFMLDDGTTMVHKRDCPVAISQASQHGDSVVPVDFVNDGTPYLVNFRILAIDRYHLLSDIIQCITEQLHLSIDSLKTITRNHIVDCVVNFYLYSHEQLQTAIDTINDIPGVEEVVRPSKELAEVKFY